MAAEAGATSKDVDILKDMTDYDSDEDKQAEPRPEEKKPAENKQGTYVATHTAGFKEFLLRPELLHAITDCGFEHPSEVQHRAIPQAILGTDILCQAKSGMGKTAVYVLSILQNELDKTNTSAVVVCPTRELAFQAAKEFERFAKSIAGVRVETLIGGLPIEEDRARLKKSGAPTVAVATPGRLLQLAEEGALDMSHVKHFVVDECDRVLGALDMRAEVQKVFVRTPRDKQVMMFSATLPEELRPLCRRFMHAPLEIYVDREKLTLHGLQQYFVQVLEPQKTRKLVDLLDSLEFNQCMIFVSSCKRAEQLNRLLSEINFPSTCVHSELKQDERIARYKKFKDFGSRVLVATDLFGRGVDMERVNVVFNYDMAPDEDQYLHRVGRAGRFGTKGLAISFVATKEEGEVLNKVQARFIVNIPELPDEIDASSYMGS